MKKIWLAGLVAVFGVALLGTSVFAGWGMGGCGGGGAGYGAATGKPVDVTAFKAFQKETLPLRDEMMVKRVELRNESLKEKPDQNRIATLQKEMIDLRAKIRTAAENGLPAAGFGRGMGGGRGHGMGRGMGGQGGSRGLGNCPNWKYSPDLTTRTPGSLRLSQPVFLLQCPRCGDNMPHLPHIVRRMLHLRRIKPIISA